MARTLCGVKVESGSTVPSGGATSHGGRLYGRLHNFHGSKSYLLWKYCWRHGSCWRNPWKLRVGPESINQLPWEWKFLALEVNLSSIPRRNLFIGMEDNLLPMVTSMEEVNKLPLCNKILLPLKRSQQ